MKTNNRTTNRNKKGRAMNNKKVVKSNRDKMRDELDDNKSSHRSSSSSKHNSFANDPSWYNVYPDLVNSTANIPAGIPMGIDYDITNLSDVSAVLNNDTHTMRLFYVHGVGYTESDRDPVNLAATKLYSYVRHANSGHSNYERSDLMLYFLATIEAYNLIAQGIRVYGALNLFNTYNRAFPKYVIKSMGWDYDSVVEDQAKLRTYINNFIARVNSLYIPTELNIIKRWWWLNTTVFTDSTGPKAMNYVFTPSIYRWYDELSSDNGGFLKSEDIPESWSVTQWRSAVEKVLNNLLDSEDIGIISGDILKAYGDRVFSLEMIAEDYVTPFVFSEEVLTQINNTTVLGVDLLNTDITQETSSNLNTGLRYVPYIDISEHAQKDKYRNAIFTDPVMNFQTMNPTPMDVMIASRNVVCGDDYDPENDYKIYLVMGSEVVTHEKIYSVGGSSDVVPSFLGGIFTTTVQLALIHTKFDYCPLLKHFNDGVDPMSVNVTCSHYENLVPVFGNALSRIHDTALLSLFTALV